MIDLHCHLLPAIDDGAEHVEEALAMAASAVTNGITHCVLTPHMHEGRYTNTLSNLKPKVDALRESLHQNDVKLQVGLGAEVRVGFEVLDWLDKAELPFIGQWSGRDVLLLELPHGQIPPGSDKLILRLVEEGIQPMIAHPERNKQIMKNLSALMPFMEMGCLLQLTAGSLVNRFGARVRDTSFRILKKGWAHVLATDAHSMKWRPPELAEGRAEAARVIGESESWRLVLERPALIAATHFPDLQKTNA